MRSTLARHLLVISAFVGFGCDDDSPLPAGFEDAKKVELVQAYLSNEKGGEREFDVPEGVHDGDTSLSIRDGRGHVLYVGNVGCNNPYAGYVTHDGDAYDLLLRFEAKSGAGPTACGGALYAFRVVLDEVTADTSIHVYHQGWEEAEAKRVGSARARADDADCASFFACGGDAGKCKLDGATAEDYGPFGGPDDYLGCVEVEACGRSVCAWTREACLMTCGVPNCNIREEYPLGVGCK